jgi:polysaccharide deacetylase 2 family uncharacterized protein YibQ
MHRDGQVCALPVFVRTRWLPTCPRETQSTFSNALTASFPEILLNFPMEPHHSIASQMQHFRVCEKVGQYGEIGLYGYKQRGHSGWKGIGGLLIFSP